METLARPSTFWDCKPSLKYCLRLQFLPIAELSSAKGLVITGLTLTNWIPPVNDQKARFRVTEGVVTRGHHGTGDFPVGGQGGKGIWCWHRASGVFAVL